MTNIHEAKAKLTEFVEAAARGERVLICNRNRPVAELRAVEAVRTEPRPLEPALSGFALPSSFFEPLANEVLDGFDGRSEDGRGAARVAEGHGAYRPARTRRSKRS